MFPTGAEGSIRDIRHLLGTQKHNSKNDLCTARLAILSSVRSAKSTCCYDYTPDSMAKAKENWLHSTKRNQKLEEKDKVDSDSDS